MSNEQPRDAYQYAVDQGSMHVRKANDYAARALNPPEGEGEVMRRTWNFYAAATETMRAIAMITPYINCENEEIASFVRTAVSQMADNARDWFNAERAMWEAEEMRQRINMSPQGVA
jgi:hypothetical protein